MWMKWIVILALAGMVGIVRAAVWPDSEWQRATAATSGLDEGKLNAAREYALTGGGSGYIVRGGKLVLSWGDAQKLYDLKSTTKSFRRHGTRRRHSGWEVAARRRSPAASFHPRHSPWKQRHKRMAG
jgi:hypothetical protein